MKHTEQSQLTRQTLSAALKKLMETKPLSRITISEIVDSCGLNRKTFYYHFEDIYALLKWTLDQEAIAQFDKFDLVTQHTEAIGFALDYIAANHAMLRNIVHSIGRSELSRFFYNDIYQSVYRLVCTCAENRKLDAGEEYRAFLGKFLTEAIAGVLMDCIERDSLSDRKELTRRITVTLTASITASLEEAANKSLR